MRHHVPYSTEPCLSAKVGSEAATCPVALDPASLIGRVPTPPRVSWLSTRWEGSDVLRVLRLWILPTCWEGSRLPHVLRFPVGRGPQI
jgi:hypothetical protein